MRTQLVDLRADVSDFRHNGVSSGGVARLLSRRNPPRSLVSGLTQLVGVVSGPAPLLIETDDLVDVLVRQLPPVVVGPNDVSVFSEHVDVEHSDQPSGLVSIPSINRPFRSEERDVLPKSGWAERDDARNQVPEYAAAVKERQARLRFPACDLSHQSDITG